LNSIGNQISSTYDITIQQLASYYGHTGGKGNLGKKRTKEHRANISAGNLGKKETEEHRANISAGILGKKKTEEQRANIVGGRVQSDMVKWIDNFARVKTFIDTEERMPSKKNGDADEKQHARWIKNNRFHEKGTNSEREQLMRRDIPLVFVGGRVQSDMVKWIDNLSRVKTFIDTKGECQE